jgi:hypothetical protein
MKLDDVVVTELLHAVADMSLIRSVGILKSSEVFSKLIHVSIEDSSFRLIAIARTGSGLSCSKSSSVGG